MIAIIVAKARNNVIGKANDLPWYIPEDLRHFKEVTIGNTVIMGRKTYESILARLGKPLPDRRNIVITSQELEQLPGMQTAASLEEAIKMAEQSNDNIFIIGGASIYEDALQKNLIDEMYITNIDVDVDGDAFFPDISEKDWRMEKSEAHTEGDFTFSFDHYLKSSSSDSEKKYNFKNTRHQEQAERMKQLQRKGQCFLCAENLGHFKEVAPIEIENQHWYVKANDFPYENTRLHMLIVSKTHLDTISKLPKAAKADFLEIVSQCESRYNLSAYAIGFRSGDPGLTGGTISHLHAHLIVGDTDNPKHEPVRFKMSSKP